MSDDSKKKTPIALLLVIGGVILIYVIFIASSSSFFKPLFSEEVDYLCNDTGTYLYRNGTEWGCGSISGGGGNTSQTNFTITENATHIIWSIL